jgi:aminoglycoside phosphotransferase (APT) family kinase protein
VIYRWIPGITLNECRRHHAPATMESLGEPIGELLATLSGCPLDILTNDTRERLQAPRSSIDATLGATIHRLRGNRVRSRLGAARADALADLVRRRTSDLCALDSRVALVHGDVSGRNVLVASINERWQAAALLDWEHAFLGSPLWDVGSLFRYAHRYSEPFRSGFEAGYRAAGGALAEDWLFVARLLDATRLVEILDGANDLPAVFGECHDLVERLGNEAASRVCPL